MSSVEIALGINQVQRSTDLCVRQVRGLLFKLQAIFDLPKRLHTALQQGAVEIAVNAFADAAPLLKRYGHKVPTSLLCPAPSTNMPHA